MTSIITASRDHCQLLSDIAKLSFIESHGNSAKAEDINNYITNYYSINAFEEELNESNNIYRIIYYNGLVAGYSKIVFNTPYTSSTIKNITKMERLYLLKEFYDLKLGFELLQFNIDLSKRNSQLGMWLYTWKENHRAVNFYKKNGFQIIGSHDFKISETHSNPNHQMFLQF